MTEAEYIAALAEVWDLMNTVPDTEEGLHSEGGLRLVKLATAVAEYEMMHYPVEG